MKNTVHLVGAGPGDPGLITKRGLDLVRRADVIVVDALVNPALLHENPTAEIHYVGKRGGSKHNLPQGKINSLLIRLAGSGRRVVRLKGGDPFVFGRGGEEVEALHKAGILCDIVPGVTSAIAAPAFAGIPVSDRRWSSQVTFFTGHEGKPSEDGSSGVDWSSLSPTGTLVVLMGVAEWPSIRRNLLKRGWPAATPVAAIEAGTTRQQRVLTTILNRSEKEFHQKKLTAPAVIVVGKVAHLAKTRAWIKDMKPLLGRTVVVTRTAHQNGSLTALLEDRGARVIECPAIDVRPLQNNRHLEQMISHLTSYDWVIFLSVNAVEAFALLLKSKANLLRSTKICVVGPATADQIRKHGWKVHRVAKIFNSQGIIKALGNIRRQRILIPRVQNGPAELPEALRRRGAVVEEVSVYETVAAPPPPAHVKKIILNDVDAITFTSASTVRFFAAYFSKNELKILFRKTKMFSIGPFTTATLKQLGVRNVVQAPIYTLPNLVETLCRFMP